MQTLRLMKIFCHDIFTIFQLTVFKGNPPDPLRLPSGSDALLNTLQQKHWQERKATEVRRSLPLKIGYVLNSALYGPA